MLAAFLAHTVLPSVPLDQELLGQPCRIHLCISEPDI